MRFLANMGISPRTVKWLRSQGHEAIRLVEKGWQFLTDEEIVIKARQEERIILTRDFGIDSLIVMSGELSPSIILLRLNDERPEMVNEILAEVLPQFANELELGAIITVSEEAIRVRKLPI
ncbi:DUF5615 family PIN-like protein [Microseira sp. BLCC-F43]|jgi:predicted nuclease of predicted toxin-antitoxin system|uniref:DUF5615 family PIN-like protein n=1 Tax=Microseira sp. BLCC-F43 TaxID=3153602 RepID=UPI0035B757F7